MIVILAALAAPATATTQCGNAVTDPGEDCDDGGTCIGGSNAGTPCTAESACTGTGVCVGGTRIRTACASDADCVSGACRHCIPQGGDGCAANCTFEHDVPLPMVPGQLHGLSLLPGTGGVSIVSDFLSIPVSFRGRCRGGDNSYQPCTLDSDCPRGTCIPAQEILTVGKERDGKVPVVVKANAVALFVDPIPTVGCVCVSGLAAKTCGGVLFDDDGVTPALDCTPVYTAGAGICTSAGKPPCTFVHGNGNTASGEIGCDGLDGVDVIFTQDAGGTSGVAAPFMISASGRGGPGAAAILRTTALSAALGQCTGMDQSTYGPDGVYCTADDPPGGIIFLEATAPAVSGVATAVVHNADGTDGHDVGPASATGAPFDCAALANGSAAGAGLVQAFALVHQPTVGDLALAAQFFAGPEILPTPTPAPAACIGDCDYNGAATVDELVTMVNIVLENTTLAACPSADANGDGLVSITQLVLAVNNLLHGCPTPTATPSPT